MSLDYTDDAPGMDLDAEDGFEDFDGAEEESEKLAEPTLGDINDMPPESDSEEGIAESQFGVDDDIDKDSKI
jgi:hypothetical protein